VIDPWRKAGMAEFPSGMSDERLAEIRERLDDLPPFIALAGSNQRFTPVASYLRLLRSDQIELVNEIDRLKAELEAARRPLATL
jgi:hypothetical protein